VLPVHDSKNRCRVESYRVSRFDPVDVVSGIVTVVFDIVGKRNLSCHWNPKVSARISRSLHHLAPVHDHCTKTFLTEFELKIFQDTFSTSYQAKAIGKRFGRHFGWHDTMHRFNPGTPSSRAFCGGARTKCQHGNRLSTLRPFLRRSFQPKAVDSTYLSLCAGRFRRQCVVPIGIDAFVVVHERQRLVQRRHSVQQLYRCIARRNPWFTFLREFR
jgi:hypothetical protein